MSRTMSLQSNLRLTLRQLVELQAAPKLISIGSPNRGAYYNHKFVNSTLEGIINHRAFSTQRRTISMTSLSSSSSLCRPLGDMFTSRQPAYYFSSTPPPSPASSSNDAPAEGTKILSTKSTSDPFTEVGSSNKSIFAKLWDRYSFEGQTKRIVLGERLFRAAQARASDV